MNYLWKNIQPNWITDSHYLYMQWHSYLYLYLYIFCFSGNIFSLGGVGMVGTRGLGNEFLFTEIMNAEMYNSLTS